VQVGTSKEEWIFIIRLIQVLSTWTRKNFTNKSSKLDRKSREILTFFYNESR